MEIDTVFGFKWKVGTPEDFLLFFVILLLVIAIFGLIRYRFFLEDRKIHDYQLFLFKMRRLGLSNFQIKILNNMTKILRLSNPGLFLDNSRHFEDAIGRFLLFLRGKNELEESMASICKDITIIYEKVYHYQLFKKPLDRMQDIELNQLLYFIIGENNVYLGKIISKDNDILQVQLFRPIKEIQRLKEPGSIKVHIWRIGDAEYEFTSETIGLTDDVVSISFPVEFSRGKEFRHPYIDVIIPAVVGKFDLKPLEEPEHNNGTIIKVNDYEIVIRMNKKLEYKYHYKIECNLLEFQFSVVCTLIADKTINENNLIYYTFKFIDMSEGAKHVLKKYIYEHL